MRGARGRVHVLDCSLDEAGARVRRPHRLGDGTIPEGSRAGRAEALCVGILAAELIVVGRKPDRCAGSAWEALLSADVLNVAWADDEQATQICINRLDERVRRPARAHNQHTRTRIGDVLPRIEAVFAVDHPGRCAPRHHEGIFHRVKRTGDERVQGTQRVDHRSRLLIRCGTPHVPA
eukprot:scaffold17676_cov108-Isochrysis_galbana.AAC.7